MSWNNTVESKQILSKEIGTIIKDWGGKLPIALAYPNTYYVGMSSLALQILYRRFNEHVDVVCERVFWDKGGWEARRPLRSLETQQRAEEFAVWAFTISYEMDYFNVVEMLRQAGVPPLAADRNERWPLLIAGGPGITMNPEPMAPFFDAIVIGEGEEVVDTLVDTIRDVGDDDRTLLLEALDRIEGIYVPQLVAEIRANQIDPISLIGPNSELGPILRPRRIKRLWVRHLEHYPTVSSLYTPDTEFGGLHLMEIARGCGRGCRFCLAGYFGSSSRAVLPGQRAARTLCGGEPLPRLRPGSITAAVRSGPGCGCLLCVLRPVALGRRNLVHPADGLRGGRSVRRPTGVATHALRAVCRPPGAQYPGIRLDLASTMSAVDYLLETLGTRPSEWN